MKFAFFDTKPYDRPAFERYGEEKGIKFKFYETRLTEDNVSLAADTTPALLAYFVSGIGVDAARSFIKIDGIAVSSLVSDRAILPYPVINTGIPLIARSLSRIKIETAPSAVNCAFFN